MTDSAPNPPQAEASQVPSGKSKAQKPRSPVERAIVWGGILIMLGIAGVQGYAYLNYSQTIKPIQAAVKESDDTEKVVTEEMVKGWVKGQPQYETSAPDGTQEMLNAKRMDVYTWKGVFRSYVLKVFYGVGDNPEVVSMSAQ